MKVSSDDSGHHFLTKEGFSALSLPRKGDTNTFILDEADKALGKATARKAALRGGGDHELSADRPGGTQDEDEHANEVSSLEEALKLALESYESLKDHRAICKECATIFENMRLYEDLSVHEQLHEMVGADDKLIATLDQQSAELQQVLDKLQELKHKLNPLIKEEEHLAFQDAQLYKIASAKTQVGVPLKRADERRVLGELEELDNKLGALIANQISLAFQASRDALEAYVHLKRASDNSNWSEPKYQYVDEELSRKGTLTLHGVAANSFLSSTRAAHIVDQGLKSALVASAALKQALKHALESYQSSQQAPLNSSWFSVKEALKLALKAYESLKHQKSICKDCDAMFEKMRLYGEHTQLYEIVSINDQWMVPFDRKQAELQGVFDKLQKLESKLVALMQEESDSALKDTVTLNKKRAGLQGVVDRLQALDGELVLLIGDRIGVASRVLKYAAEAYVLLKQTSLNSTWSEEVDHYDGEVTSRKEDLSAHPGVAAHSFVWSTRVALTINQAVTSASEASESLKQALKRALELSESLNQAHYT